MMELLAEERRKRGLPAYRTEQDRKAERPKQPGGYHTQMTQAQRVTLMELIARHLEPGQPLPVQKVRALFEAATGRTVTQATVQTYNSRERRFVSRVTSFSFE